ncbi:hypothetical protein I7I48_04535 [Histoplasma ohiense]|nr:hypothetical protein I7I48_04535 [Histoplasma ohiense (nom. inval.)]
MPITRHLLREEITYSTAKGREANILHQLGYHDKQTFFFKLNDSRDWIKSVVTHHLGLVAGLVDLCRVAEVEDWFHGSCNVCVPVTIEDEIWKRKKQGGRHVLLRLPLPYRIGEVFRSRNGDENVRCEAGTYAWLQENCPEATHIWSYYVYRRNYTFYSSVGYPTQTSSRGSSTCPSYPDVFNPPVADCSHGLIFQLLLATSVTREESTMRLVLAIW